jgi:cytochrome d ubiquinol oxidase subunit I
MELTALDLSRIQFALNISFHILFPTITISLGWILFYFKIKERGEDGEYWKNAYDRFVKLFALSFAMGVVSGITMSFQFGTNWPEFMNKVGNIAGPLLAYEVLTAFFLEAVFVGIMLFGRKRVSYFVHTLSTFLVAFGTTLSAFWILVLNSWMHTPTGYEIVDGVVHAKDWLEIIFNPSMPFRLVHMLVASGLTSAFILAGLSAYRYKKLRQYQDLNILRFTSYLAAVLIPIQIFIGDIHGLNTLEHQPAKVAAMEGNWETQKGVPLILFAVPDEENRENYYEIGIPNLASLILTHHLDGEVPGLNDFVGKGGEIEHPPVSKVFYSFRIMVGIGLLMLFVSWYMSYRFLTKRKPLSNWELTVVHIMTFSGWVATLAGWYVTEIGRQPWLVHGILKTKDAVSDVSSGMLTFSLLGYILVYIVLMFAYIGTIYYLMKKDLK